MTQAALTRCLAALAGVIGASGVALGALAVHQPDAARLGIASSMLLFHAAALLGLLALREAHVLHGRLGLVAASGMALGVLLFAGDLTLRQYAGHGLFPRAAPTGGTLLIASWLLSALAAAWPRYAP
ncbi:MAG: hypothetical protein BGP05_05170 [Rhizobiales bacterium 62-47]|nr:DUF423 domain-containing protein [Hyphomicrobiales bacterium]ODU76601.1 MAG: hypothetical protein ABT00_15090 [Bordetella sp. SCN 68-11]OJY09126.1 MAG: hypothetical protein BGP05_05170 [Rhizobiales bacterium 62-47]